MNKTTLEGKVGVVTGAGRGIGRAIAIGYADAGASICCAARTAQEIEDTVEEIAQHGGEAIAVPTDVSDQAAVERMLAATAEAFGGIDILVINAGTSPGRETVEQSEAEGWRTTLEVNLFGAYYCARAAIPHLRRRGGGKIITMGSGLGHHGQPASSAYACSKAGLWTLTQVLAQELWRENISVNELIPGPVVTSMRTDAAAPPLDSIWESEWQKTPEDVLPLALFLASQPVQGPTAQSFSLMRRAM